VLLFSQLNADFSSENLGFSSMIFHVGIVVGRNMALEQVLSPSTVFQFSTSSLCSTNAPNSSVTTPEI
jgi:hypothetical protein